MYHQKDASMLPDASGQASLLALLGGFPDRPPLDVTVKHREVKDGITRVLIDYSTVPGERVEAFLLLPATGIEKPCPSIVAVHQDGDRRPYLYGKSEVAGLGGDSAMAYGNELCRRGYAVICADRFGFESRRLAASAYAREFADFPIQITGRGVDLTEDLFKGAAANRLLFQGWTSLGKELFELSRAVDVLVEYADGVDPQRVGIIGHSAGGHLAPYAMYLDDRIRVGAVSCGTWFFSHAFRTDSLRPMQGFGGFMVVPGMERWGDTDDVLAGIAPRPYWEHRGDFGPDFGASQLLLKARQRYDELGASERLQFIEHDDGHTFPESFRQQAYEWFDRWL
jgi:dienelactone hydrolase